MTESKDTTARPQAVTEAQGFAFRNDTSEPAEFMSTDAIAVEMAQLRDRAGMGGTTEADGERYAELQEEMDARDAEAAENEARGFKLFDVVESDGQIRPWHGAWRMDGGTNELHTAIFPLNLVMRAYWAVVVFVKVGKVAMGADPRAAFIDGYEAALRDGPGNLLAQQKSLESQEEALREYAEQLGERESRLRAEQRLLSATATLASKFQGEADDKLLAALTGEDPPKPSSITPTAG